MGIYCFQFSTNISDKRCLEVRAYMMSNPGADPIIKMIETATTKRAFKNAETEIERFREILKKGAIIRVGVGYLDITNIDEYEALLETMENELGPNYSTKSFLKFIRKWKKEHPQPPQSETKTK